METIELIIQLSKLIGGVIIVWLLYRINENIKEKNREANYMTTKTSKEKSGKTPLKPDKKAALYTQSPEELKRRRDYDMAMAKRLGFKEVPLKGATVWIPEGALF